MGAPIDNFACQNKNLEGAPTGITPVPTIKYTERTCIFIFMIQLNFEYVCKWLKFAYFTQEQHASVAWEMEATANALKNVPQEEAVTAQWAAANSQTCSSTDILYSYKHFKFQYQCAATKLTVRLYAFFCEAHSKKNYNRIISSTDQHYLENLSGFQNFFCNK